LGVGPLLADRERLTLRLERFRGLPRSRQDIADLAVGTGQYTLVVGVVVAKSLQDRQRPPELRNCSPEVALANPKSMTLDTGLPSWLSTRMFEGFKSRWMIPF
jgi:hypothetical protein